MEIHLGIVIWQAMLLADVTDRWQDQPTTTHTQFILERSSPFLEVTFIKLQVS